MYIQHQFIVLHLKQIFHDVTLVKAQSWDLLNIQEPIGKILTFRIKYHVCFIDQILQLRYTNKG